MEAPPCLLRETQARCAEHEAFRQGVLGFHLEGDQLRLAPCIPLGWTQFELMFRYRSARYDITVDNRTGTGHKVVEIQIDGMTIPDRGGIIPLSDDARTHAVRVTLCR